MRVQCWYMQRREKAELPTGIFTEGPSMGPHYHKNLHDKRKALGVTQSTCFVIIYHSDIAFNSGILWLAVWFLDFTPNKVNISDMIVAKKAGQHRTTKAFSRSMAIHHNPQMKKMHNTQSDNQLLVSQLQDVLKLDST